MSQPFDISAFPDLPPDVVKAFEAQQFELSVERAARLHEQAAVAEKAALICELTYLVEKLQCQIAQYKRAKFGPKSEKLNPAQLQLALEVLETAMAETEERIAAVEERIDGPGDPEQNAPRKPRKSRALPENMPRVERVIEPETIACPCGCGDMVRIGEDRSERIDVVPAQYRVLSPSGPNTLAPRGARAWRKPGSPRICWKAVGLPRRCSRLSALPLMGRGRAVSCAAEPSGAGHGPSRIPGRPLRSADWMD